MRLRSERPREVKAEPGEAERESKAWSGLRTSPGWDQRWDKMLLG